jgi:uncharacterized membrane protein
MQERNRWIIKRNCSASPRLLALVFGSMLALSLAFGLAFAAAGLWVVLPFVGLELAALALAFFCYGRHAADFEAARSTTVRLTRPWARVELEQGAAGLRGRVRVFLAARGERVEVGRLLAEDRRVALARELRQALQAA